MDVDAASAKFGIPVDKITKEINKPPPTPKQPKHPKSRNGKQPSTKVGPQDPILTVHVDSNQQILIEIRNLLRLLVDQKQSPCQCPCEVKN
jgi:hypothetical protein